MKVAMLHDYLDIRIEEMARPEPGPGQAVVRARACGICSGDVVPWYIRKKAPLVFGHEPVGEISAIGAGVAHLDVGTRVFVHHHAPCLQCHFCQRGEHVQCATWRATRIIPGGMAEFFLVPEANLMHDTLAIPDHVTDADATLVEPTACVVKSLGRAGAIEGASILVIGLGVMGQLHVALARHMGASRIIATDLVAARCAHARQLGADDVIDASAVDVKQAVAALTDGVGVDIVIVGPATTDAMGLGIGCVARGGTVIQFMGTPPDTTLQISTNDLYFREIRLIPSYSCGPLETRTALGLIESGIIRASQVVTHRFALDDAAEAYRVAATNQSAIKTLVMFPGATG